MTCAFVCTGTLYKCVNCDSFEICANCELEGHASPSAHYPMHVFLKLRRRLPPTGDDNPSALIPDNGILPIMLHPALYPGAQQMALRTQTDAPVAPSAKLRITAMASASGTRGVGGLGGGLGGGMGGGGGIGGMPSEPGLRRAVSQPVRSTRSGLRVRSAIGLGGRSGGAAPTLTRQPSMEEALQLAAEADGWRDGSPGLGFDSGLSTRLGLADGEENVLLSSASVGWVREGIVQLFGLLSSTAMQAPKLQLDLFMLTARVLQQLVGMCPNETVATIVPKVCY